MAIVRRNYRMHLVADALIVFTEERRRKRADLVFFSNIHLSESTKALVASMLLLCQHSHYVSADSKLLLYLFSLYDIFYFTFLIIFFFVC